MALWKKVLIGLFLGIVFGYVLEDVVQDKEELARIAMYFKEIGMIFVNLIMMIVGPLIFFSLVAGVNNLNDSTSLGRIGWKATIAYMTTSMFAISFGLLVANLVDPGAGLERIAADAAGADKPKPHVLVDMLLSVIPKNIVGAFSGTPQKANTIQVVFAAIFVGVTLLFMGQKGKRLVEFCDDAAQLMFAMIGHIIKLAPYAVFFLMANTYMTTGIEAFEKLILLVLCTIGAIFVHYILLGILLFFVAGINPLQFYKKGIEYQLLAFSTTSSKATLANAMQVAEEKIGISKQSSSFILPLGAAINMDGTAIYLGILAVFFASFFGIELEFIHYVMIVFTATVASIGAAGYPGGSLVMLGLVLSVFGVTAEQTAEAVAFIVAIDRILDMFRTTINVTSDVAITTMIDKSEGRFNEKLYNTPIEDIRNNRK